jgi:hypothetical protein
MNQPYGPPFPVPLHDRLRSLGTLALVLSIMQIASTVLGLLSNLGSSSMMGFQRQMMGGGAAQSEAIFKAAEEFSGKIAVAEAIRGVPFAIASGWLLMIAMRLRRGDVTALKPAREWPFVAFGVLALSVIVQLTFSVPAMMEYQQRIVSSMPAMPKGRGAPPFDFAAMMETMMAGAAYGGMVIGTVVMSIWPIVLRVWSGRLLRDAQAQPPAPPGL